jgi:hypothetical protein
MRRLLAVTGLLAGLTALGMIGCQSSEQTATAADDAASPPTEERSVAQASLGSQAEILAQGDLAITGREQLLVVNRLMPSGQAGKSVTKTAPVVITRATVLEKNDGKWTEILRCDEHLKNTNGYLGGVTRARISSWRLEYDQDAKAGLDLKFSPAEDSSPADRKSSESSPQPNAAFDVRWNKNTKRYMSFDQSHERYLTELPLLETPESSLR